MSDALVKAPPLKRERLRRILVDGARPHLRQLQLLELLLCRALAVDLAERGFATVIVKRFTPGPSGFAGSPDWGCPIHYDTATLGSVGAGMTPAQARRVWRRLQGLR